MKLDHPAADGAVVVAVDDSAPSHAALTWAAEFARSVQADLQAVHVLQYEYHAPGTWASGLGIHTEMVAAPRVEAVKNRLQDWFDDLLPAPSWTLSFLEGPVAQTIAHQARDARLLVVGTHEHRGIERLLVSSVGHYCLTHGSCPMVAVPPARSAECAPSTALSRCPNRKTTSLVVFRAVDQRPWVLSL